MIPFYDRSESERITLTQSAIAEKRTLFERWIALKDNEASPWSARSAIAAQYFADQDGVADFGCGTMTLEQHLRPGQFYIPIDVIARDTRTIVCDLNCTPPPLTAANAAACLGLLEYLHHPGDFLRILSTHYHVAVISYNPINAHEPSTNRRAHGWVNDFDMTKLENLFCESMWVIHDSKRIDSAQMIYKLYSPVSR